MTKNALPTLADRSHFLESLYAAVPDVILTINEEGAIETCNNSVLEMFGYTTSEITGKNLSSLFAEPYRIEYESQIAETIGSGKSDFLRVSRRIEGQRKNSSVFPISFTAAEVSQLPRQNRKLFAFVIRDITKILHTEIELEKLTRNLARSNAELKQFAAVVSHDLQAPLRTISAFSGLIARRAHGLDEDAKDKLGRIIKAAERMRALTSNLLELAQVSEKPPQFEWVELKDVYEEVVSDLSALITESGATLSRNPLPRVFGDKRQLRQLLQNLIGNSIKFRRTGVAPEIYVSALEENPLCTISVSDNGISIEPKHRERIFGIFQRLHSTGEYPGSGIGLAICKKIVERHGGSIWVDTKEGPGSHFSFTLKTHEEKNRFTRE